MLWYFPLTLRIAFKTNFIRRCHKNCNLLARDSIERLKKLHATLISDITSIINGALSISKASSNTLVELFKQNIIVCLMVYISEHFFSKCVTRKNFCIIFFCKFFGLCTLTAASQTNHHKEFSHFITDLFLSS